MVSRGYMKPAEDLSESPTPETPASRFELLVQSVTDYAIYMLDPTGRVTSWNAGAKRFKGYEADEIIGDHFSRFYTPEEKMAGVPRVALETAEREGRFEAEGWRVRKDGTRFWANVVIDPIRDPSGALVGFAKVTRDLTERRAAEEELRRSEERFRLLIESVTDYAIYMLDPTGAVISWNPGAQRFKGYSADEIIGQHFSRFYTEEDKESGIPKRALETAEREGKFEAEGWRVRKDGTRFWANVVIDPVRDALGKLIGFAKITRDLTERMEAQRALEETRAAFFQSQKLEAIGKLTGGIAHDFNNLLSVIVGSLDLARRRMAEGGDVSRLLDNAAKAAERGADLTQRMLAFARRQELKLETVDVAGLVRGMAELAQRTLGPEVSIETRFPLMLGKVSADARQLELALLNLAVNARDAMPEGGKIVIAARQERIAPPGRDGLEPGDYVCISVVDRGEGMSEETLTRAMEPFFTTKGVGKGTGLGLSMVQGFAQQCGGALLLKSKPGEGTTAEVWLRMSADQGEPAPVEAEAAAPDIGRLRIIAVDDDSLVLTNTAEMLEELGHEVFQAGSGAQALRLLAEQAEVDLVLTDYAMPTMTGAQLADAIEQDRPGLPVLMVSGYAELPPGAVAHLPKLAKPFREGELAKALADATAKLRT
jgi:PAS domain S-box-containing protein